MNDRFLFLEQKTKTRNVIRMYTDNTANKVINVSLNGIGMLVCLSRSMRGGERIFEIHETIHDSNKSEQDTRTYPIAVYRKPLHRDAVYPYFKNACEKTR